MVAGFVAGVGTMIVFSLAILGATKFAEANRDGKAPEATVFAVLAVLGLAATAARGGGRADRDDEQVARPRA